MSDDFMNDEFEKITIGWLTIPNQIVFDESLRPLSKFVLGLILSFQYQSQCYASDKWFAKQFNCSVRTIETVMQELRENGYIETNYSPSTKKRLILPANINIWKAYSSIRNGSYAHMQNGLVEDKPTKTQKTPKQTTDISKLKKIWQN